MSENEELKKYIWMVKFLDENTQGYLYLYDMIQGKLYFTDKFCRKYPILCAGETGVSLEVWSEIVYPGDRKQLEINLEKIRQGLSKNHDIEYRLIDKEGNRVWIKCRGKVQNNAEGCPWLLLGSVEELQFEHKVDRLTGLWNYDKFMEDMENSLKQEDGYLLELGIDNFKKINVKNGWAFGDSILKMVAEVLENYAEHPMKLYRLSGDCFAVNFVRGKREDILKFYYVVQKKLKKYCALSAGAVEYRHESEVESRVVYQYMENTLDRAKYEGKNMLKFFSLEDYQAGMEQIVLLEELRTSAENKYKGFYLCYQPQVDSHDFSLYGAEALLRYESPSRGVISPVEFIPLLEQNGLIDIVGEWVLKTAALQCAEWRKSMPSFHMSVNISYEQLRKKNISEIVLKTLQEAGIPGEALTLEVTESMQLQDYPYFNRLFYEWRKYGIKIAIDDFGTGYSSLSYLKGIDVDETKIDRSFVSRIQYNAYNSKLLSNMIELAHSAQIRVCCEGVETEEELIALQELNADTLQGFLFAKPYKADEFERIYFEPESREYRERMEREKNFEKTSITENKEFLENLRKEELGNIVEAMDEIICVRDVDTHDLYYLNPTGRRQTGMYDYKGKKCYQVLLGRDQPCECCAKRELHEGMVLVSEARSEILGKRLLTKKKLIPWQGKSACLEVVVGSIEETL